MYNIIFSRLSLWIIAFVVLIFPFQSVCSQEQQMTNSTHNGHQLEEVEVTNFWKTPLQKTQLAREITSISTTDILMQRSASLDQLLSQQAGIFITGANQTQASLRSTFFQGARGVYTMYMIDGIPVISPFGDQFELRSFSTRPLDRVEIVSGGNSVLYGSSAVAGAINLVTVPYGDEIGKLSAKAGFSYGSFNTFSSDISIGQRFKKVAFNLGYEGTQTDGISAAASPTLPLSALENDRFGRNNFNAKANVTLGKWSLEPFFRFSKIQYAYDENAFKDNDSLKRNFQLWQAGMKVSLSVTPKASVHLMYSANVVDENTLGAYGRDTNSGVSHYLDVYSVTKLNRLFQLVGGVQTQQLQFINYQKSVKSQFSINPYATLLFNLNNIVFVEAGARLIYDDIYQWDYATNLAIAVNPFKFLRLHASYAKSYLAPNLKQLYGQWGANTDLQPEQTHSFQAGFTFSLLQNRLTFGVTGYIRNIEDVIDYDTAYINVGKEYQVGQEVKVSFKVNKQWTISAWYSHVDGSVNQLKKEIQYLLRRPQHSFGADVKTHLFSKLYAQLGIYYYGDRTDMNYSVYPYAEVSLNSYAIVNINISSMFLNDKLELYVALKNLTDARFTEVYGYSTMGFNWTLGIRASL